MLQSPLSGASHERDWRGSERQLRDGQSGDSKRKRPSSDELSGRIAKPTSRTTSPLAARTDKNGLLEVQWSGFRLNRVASHPSTPTPNYTDWRTCTPSPSPQLERHWLEWKLHHLQR